ncbi:sensor histidine kinase [Paenibacillus sp. WLX2291]|uniref:cache domain-containing sensor histidine kinase n=1 Tax=Paenibacillus sp. WLX2291 TaxID=3296934 RepID=UPI00398449AF
MRWASGWRGWLERTGIRGKIAVLFIGVITLTAVLSNGILYVVFTGIMREQLLEDQQNIMLQSRNNIQNVETSIDQATYYFSTDKTIADILNQPTADDIERYRNLNIMNQQFIKYLDVPLSSVVNAYSALFFVSDTSPVAQTLPTTSLQLLGGLSDSGGNRFFSPQLAAGEEWFKRTVELQGTLNIFYADGDQEHVYVAKQVRNPLIMNSNNEMGVVVIAIDKNEFGRQIENSQLTSGTRLLLADQSNRVLYSNDRSWTGVQITDGGQLAPLLEYADVGGSTDLDYNHTSYIADVYPLKWGWNLVALIPYSDVTERLSIIRYLIAGITGMVIIVGVVLTLIVSNSIARPVIKLANVMKKIKDESNIDVFIEPPEQNEVGVLYRQFNNLMQRINGLVDDVVRSGEREKQAEMKALQAQINPHFIYNTLDSVNWLALSRGEDDIATMVSSLAAILRYSIREPGEKVPLEQEIDHVRNYVSIQQMRYGNNFDVQYDIDSQLYRYPVPKFIIQPLIENAIQHGTERHSGQGHIVLRAQIIEGTQSERSYGKAPVINDIDIGDLSQQVSLQHPVTPSTSDDSSSHTMPCIRLIIEDNGPGGDIVTLNQYLNDQQEALPSSDGIGIRNVHQRIRLHDNDERYGLHFEYENGVMKSIITLPYEERR